MAIERITRSLTIEAPRDEVFLLLASPDRTPEWLIGVRSVKTLTPGPVRVGSETLSSVEALGRLWDARGRCLELDPPNRIVVETLLGPGLKSRSDSRLEAASGTTTLLHAELAFQRPGGPLGMLFDAFGARERFERDFDTSLRRLKALLEGRS